MTETILDRPLNRPQASALAKSLKARELAVPMMVLWKRSCREISMYLEGLIEPLELAQLSGVVPDGL